MNTAKKLYSFTALAAVVVLSAGCKPKNPDEGFVRNGDVSAITQDGEIHAIVSAQLNTGNLNFPAAEFPIKNPNNHDVILGTIGVQPILGGGAQLVMNINVSSAAGIEGVDPLLPNGNELPVGGLGDAEVIGLPVGNNGALAYLALSANNAMIGGAVPIREFANFGGKEPGLSLFYPFTTKKGTPGLAGVFTGEGELESGIGFFFDLSGLLNRDEEIAGNIAMASSALRVEGAPVVAFTYDSKKVKARSYRKIRRGLYKLHRRKTRVSYE